MYEQTDRQLVQCYNTTQRRRKGPQKPRTAGGPHQQNRKISYRFIWTGYRSLIARNILGLCYEIAVYYTEASNVQAAVARQDIYVTDI